MTRRELLAAALTAPVLSGKTRIDKSAGESLDFAKQYGLRWIELRDMPGPTPDMEPLRKKPETEDTKSKRLETERKRSNARKDNVRRTCTAANLFGCDKLRVFTGTRVPSKWIGLETHLFDRTLIQAAHESMENMMRIVG